MNSVTSTPLLHDFDQQEELFSSAFSVLTDAISNRAFPAAAVAVSRRDGLVALKSLGRFTYEPDSPLVTNATLFAVATTTMAMMLYERGLFELEAPVVGVVPQFMADTCGEPDARRRDVTFRMLLAHSAGLPA